LFLSCACVYRCRGCCSLSVCVCDLLIFLPRKRRKNAAQKKLRRLNDAANGARCARLLSAHDGAAVAAANALLERVPAPEQLRAQEARARAYQAAGECRVGHESV